MNTKINLLFLALILFYGCNQKESVLNVSSPNETNQIVFDLSEEGRPFYKVLHNNNIVIDTSYLGFEFKNEAPMKSNFKILGSETASFNETWQMPWGEQLSVENHYNELVVQLEEQTESRRKINIQFRAFDDGIGFRYEFPKQDGLEELTITDENTEFALTGDHKVWWIPGDWDIYEHLYTETSFTKIDALSKRDHPNLSATYIPENAVNTPVTMKTENGLYLSFHEADLTDYSGMTLKVDAENLTMVSELVGSDNLEAKAKINLPFKTPWRTIQIAEKAGDLIESKLIVNLNEPNKLGDISDYFTPRKYVGIWWEMHLGVATWDFEATQDMSTYTEGSATSKKHGATTENAKRYIDFAHENNLKGLLVEGWNTGWNQWLSGDREGIFDFMTPYPDYNFDEVLNYAKEKGVELIMHHETSAAPRTYEKQMEEAFNFMKENGINSVKTGYVGEIIPDGEYHHGQWMVKHYHKVLEEAAKKKIAVNAHEPIKATGKRRTYPNAIAREGLRGQEFNAWSIEGNPPSHLPTVAFTRMLSGPIDFTPGAFNITFDDIPNKSGNRINTTLAHQLALYVVIYSPLQMACDLPQHYMEDGKVHPMFQFIKDVGVDWQQTKVLDGEVGDFVTIARQERNTGNWFIGGITDETPVDQKISFDFLEEGKTYHAIVYKDGENADWENNPMVYSIEEMEVTKSDALDVHMASGGGFAISLHEVK